jgi:hypothetical protein
MRWICLMLMFCCNAAMAQTTAPTSQPTSQPVAKYAGAVRVEVVKTDAGYQLQRDGKPYYVKGAGAPGWLERLAESGGNSLRTWGAGPGMTATLDKAHELGLTVTLCVWMPHKGADVDYSDPAFRARQRDNVRAAVLRHRDHPALLMWSIGNEAEVGNNKPQYWTLINECARLVKELDPNHPVMTITADIGGNYANQIKTYCPDLDLWGINSYRGLFSLKNRLERQGYAGPIVITEFGPNGQWEVAKTDFGAPYEQTSSEKAAQYATLYQTQIVANPNCVGSYVFLWAQKQESTHTWFGMFLDGRATETVDTMQRLWTGQWPANLAPKLMLMDSTASGKRVQPGASFDAKVHAFDPEGLPLEYRWEIRADRGGQNQQGRGEQTQAALEGLIEVVAPGLCKFKAPAQPGRYRLFVSVIDEGNKVAYANVPFFVEEAK